MEYRGRRRGNIDYGDMHQECRLRHVFGGVVLFGRFVIIVLGISDGRFLVGAKGVFFGSTNSRLGTRVIFQGPFPT